MQITYVTLVDLSGTSGQNSYSLKVATALYEDRDIDLTIICPVPSRSTPELLSYGDVNVEYISKKIDRDPKWNVKIQPEIYQRLQKIHDESRIRGIVTSLKPGLLSLPLFSYWKDVPQILLVEGMLEKNMERISPFFGAERLYKIIVKINAMNSMYIFAADDDSNQWIKERSGVANTPVETFHHGVDIKQFAPVTISKAREKIGIQVSDGEFVVGFVGSFRDRHRLEPLVRATCNLEENTKLVLVGEGPNQKRIQQLCEELGVDACFPGFVDEGLLKYYISACDVMYGAKDADHWANPMKVFEYLSCGRPVIATREELVSFVEKNNLGKLIEKPSKEEVLSSLRCLSNQPRRERESMGKRGRDYIISNHTWGQLGSRIVDVVKSNSR
jgi:glycosyltransferase involved in cell wall biosynthesis